MIKFSLAVLPMLLERTLSLCKTCIRCMDIEVAKCASQVKKVGG